MVNLVTVVLTVGSLLLERSRRRQRRSTRGKTRASGTTTTRSSPSTARASRFASSSTRGSAAMASHSQDAPTGAVTNATFAWVPIRQAIARKTDSAKQARVRQHLLPLPVTLHQVQSAPSARNSLSRIPAHRPKRKGAKKKAPRRGLRHPLQG